MTGMPAAMIMCAGKGTRMMPLTADRPKPLVKVGDVTLLDHVLDHLRDARIFRIVANVHYLADQIEDHLALHAKDLAIQISDERDLLRDTGGGLVKALPMIGSDPFLCINADNWWTESGQPALSRMVEAWDDDAMDVLMLVIPHAQAGNTQGQGDFEMDAAGRLYRRAPDTTAPYVWTGIQMLSKRLVIDPPSNVFSTNIFWDRAIAKGRCFGLVHQGRWFDVGYPEAIDATLAALG